jgi:hypothetical protein
VTSSTSSPSTSSAPPAPTSTPPPKPKPKATPVEPLTGVAVKAVARRPVLVVKVDNASVARPQSGLNSADLVIEELVEGGITRFATMFHTTLPPTVGPVRSLRDVDRAIAGPTHGVLVASGAAGVVRRRVEHGKAQVVFPSSSANFFRSGSRPAPHNLYLAPKTVLHLASKSHRTPPTHTYLPFATSMAQSTAVRFGKAVHRINLSFSYSANPGWSYDPNSQRWLRSESGSPSRQSSGSRISARTVLILRVRTVDAGYRDPAGNFVPKTVFVGRGNAAVFSHGKYISATWVKKTEASPLQLIARHSHRPVLIAPGRTWIEMLPTKGSIRLS